MTKTFTTLEILNICAWYKQARENEKKPLNDLPLKIQWSLKKNIAVLNPIAENFTAFQNEAEEHLRAQYMGDDKSYAAKDDQGQDIRKIKDECLEDFQAAVQDVNNKINDILQEKNEVELTPLKIDDILAEVDENKHNLTVEDLEVLEFLEDGAE